MKGGRAAVLPVKFLDKSARFEAASVLTTSASAPASRTASTICVELCMVRITIFVAGAIRRISRAASSPLMTGMLTSRITRSGCNS